MALAAALASAANAESVDGPSSLRAANARAGTLGYEGNGVYLLNRTGGYYMGRLWAGDLFSVEEQSTSATFPNHVYRWGRSQHFGGQSCFWIGPRANTAGLSGDETGPDHWEYLSRTPSDGALAGCDDGQKESLQTAQDDGSRYVNDRTTMRFGSDANCAPGNANAGGPVQTWLSVAAPFHYNVSWDVTGSGRTRTYTAGAAQENPGGPLVLPAGKRVKYRYTSGSWAVVYAEGVGWGFVDKSAVHVVYTTDPSGTVHRWGRYGLEHTWDGSEADERHCGSSVQTVPAADPPLIQLVARAIPGSHLFRQFWNGSNWSQLPDLGPAIGSSPTGP